MTISSISRIITFLLAVFFLTIVVSGFFMIPDGAVLDLMDNTEFLQSILFTFKTSTIATTVAFITGVPAGYYLARKKTFYSKLMDTLFDIPIVIPPLIVGVLLLSFFNSAFIKDIYSFIFTASGATIAQFFVAFPFTVKASKNAFELVPPMYERIAMTLGATPIRSFYDTTFKIALPGIISGTVLTWLRCIGEFGATLMVGGGIAGKTENIPVYIYVNMISGDFDVGLAASVVSISIAFICIIFIKLIYRK